MGDFIIRVLFTAKTKQRRHMKVTAVVALAITVVLVLPPYLFGEFDELQAVIAAAHSYIAAAIVMMFSPQLARLMGDP